MPPTQLEPFQQCGNQNNRTPIIINMIVEPHKLKDVLPNAVCQISLRMEVISAQTTMTMTASKAKSAPPINNASNAMQPQTLPEGHVTRFKPLEVAAHLPLMQDNRDVLEIIVIMSVHMIHNA